MLLKPPLQPMLLTTREEPFDSPDYLFEYKWDGFRCLYFINKENLYLQSRKGHNLLPSFPELEKVRGTIGTGKIILDGEICCFTSRNKSSFRLLQKRLHHKEPYRMAENHPVTLVVWDLLAAADENFYNFPLLKRKTALQQYINEENRYLQISPYLREQGKKLYDTAANLSLEGIVAKEINSPYEFKRSTYWYKIKIWQYDEVIIGGYGSGLKSLAVGKKNNGNGLKYMGKIKPAFPPEEERALIRFLPGIKIKNSPFCPSPITGEDITWIKPAIRCKVKYRELTARNTFRHGLAVKLLPETQ